MTPSSLGAVTVRPRLRERRIVTPQDGPAGRWGARHRHRKAEGNSSWSRLRDLRTPSQMGPVPGTGMHSGIRWLPSGCRRTPNLSRTSRRQSFHGVSERSPVFPIPLAHLRDVVQATRFRDEIELDAGWRRCRFQHLEKPRKPPRTDTQAHSVFSCPLLDVPHSRTPRCPRSTRGTRGSPARNWWARPAIARRERADLCRSPAPRVQQLGAPHSSVEHQTYQAENWQEGQSLCFCAAASCRRSMTCAATPHGAQESPESRRSPGMSESAVSAGAPVLPCASRGWWA